MGIRLDTHILNALSYAWFSWRAIFEEARAKSLSRRVTRFFARAQNDKMLTLRMTRFLDGLAWAFIGTTQPGTRGDWLERSVMLF